MFAMTVNGKQCLVRKDSRPVSIATGIDESLRRLRIETIDLMQIHQLDVLTPLDDTMEALLAARAAGKIRAIGVSNFPLPQLRHAWKLLGGSLYSTQEQFHMLDAKNSTPLRNFTREAGMAFLAFSPLAQGVLSGKYSGTNRPTDWRSGSRFLRPKALAEVNAVLEEHARPLAVAHDADISTVSLAWALAQPGVTHVIVGASSEEQCKHNAAAMSLQLPTAMADRLGRAMASCRATSPTLLDKAAGSLTKVTRRIRRHLQSN
jgi:aryl-alcohol dehydrogenase-like predicted oxidoreductase